jgi:type II secretory pathway pseudopilin PulG
MNVKHASASAHRSLVPRDHISLRTMKTSNCSSRFDQVALTPLEVMVVLGALMILAALAWPVLAGGRAAVHRAVCSDNLRRIMSATIVYASDDRDFMPHSSWGSIDATRGPNNWCYATQLPDRGMIPSANGRMDATDQLPFFEAGQLAPLLGTPEVPICPEDWRLARSELSGLYRVRSLKLTSYAMNGAVISYGTLPGSLGVFPGRTHRLTAFPPDAFAFWERNEREPTRYFDAGARPIESQTSRHEYGGWLARFDGAVEHLATRRFRQMSGEDGPANTLPNRLWCSPDSPDGH